MVLKLVRKEKLILQHISKENKTDQWKIVSIKNIFANCITEQKVGKGKENIRLKKYLLSSEMNKANPSFLACIILEFEEKHFAIFFSHIFK